MTPTSIIFGFIFGAAVVVGAGVRLARDGDTIAARTRLGGLWVGSIFLAMATSLPELATDIAAIHLGAPNLAAGDLFGSSMANMLVLALVSLMPGAELFRRAALDNGLGAALAISLTAVAALMILIHPAGTIAGVGYGSIVLAVIYIGGVRTLFRISVVARTAGEVEELSSEPTNPDGKSLGKAIAGFIVAALVILLVAPIFARSAEGLAELSGLGSSLIGTWLVGIATSLPELVTSVTAVRLRSYDLAIGNLYGSNAVNMVMFLPLDLVHRGTPLLSSVEQVHAVSALIAIVLMAIGFGAIVYRSRGSWRTLEPSGALMLLVYLAGVALVFLGSRG